MDQHISPIHYEFSGFFLDTNLQVLIPPTGSPIRLTSKVFQTLLYLLQHAGEVVDKRTLFDVVWPNVVVEENNLNQCIAGIRKALGESASDRRFLLTIPGRGFKFIGPVAVVRRDIENYQDIESPVAAHADPGIDAVRSRGRKWVTFLASGILATLAVLGAWILHRSQMPVTSPAEYEQLTDVAEAASAPALSPDGRMLAYILGTEQFMGTGQVYVQLLPAGKPVQLTHVDGFIYAPSFSPDGNRIAFTHAAQGSPPSDWQTLTVSVLGGAPTQLLPNASGLSWIGPATVMYSEVKSGIHMGIVSSTESRAAHHEIYLPAHERGMAHFSFISPDHEWVLVVEMNAGGDFGQCRLVRFDGSTGGRAVGPPGACLSAAWSPDGQWMYFAAKNGRYSHIWRQRLASGEPQQITFGPSKETAVVAAPDGRSLITALGTETSAIWLHSAHGERRLTTSSTAWQPWLSKDGRRLYYLRRLAALGSPVELVRVDAVTGEEQVVLPGLDMQSYDISADEQEVVFTSGGAEPDVWVAAIDRHASPHVIAKHADQASFGGADTIFYRQRGPQNNYIYRMTGGGEHKTQVLPNSIWDIVSVSPDGRQVVVGVEIEGHPATAVFRTEDAGTLWQARGWWSVRWSADGKTFYFQPAESDDTDLTFAKPAADNGVPDVAVTADTRRIPYALDMFYPSADPETYVFAKSELRQNIFRIPLH